MDAGLRRRRAARRGAALGAIVLALAAPAAHAQTRDIKVAPVTTGEPRVALVIGNAAYGESPLHNPVNDAREMARTLRGQGFAVIEKLNADAIVMRRAVAEFGERTQEHGVAVFYYSGHGLQVGGRNFLVPIGAQIKTENYIAAETVDVDSVLAQMDGARSRINVVILDACRNNPFARRFRSPQRGLAFMQAPLGTFIAYATSPGDVADDGPPGGYGTFTGELVRAMHEPLPIEEMFKRVIRAVQQKTNRRQTPWMSSNFTGEFSFVVRAESSAPTLRPSLEITEEVRRQFGSLGLSSPVDGVEVLLGDRRLGEIREGRTLVVSNVVAGTYRLTAKKAGHIDWEREISVTGNQRSDVLIEIEPTWQSTLARALDRYKAGDYAAAAPLFQSAAKEASGDAKWHLALLLESGKGGLPRDTREAARLVRAAAELGHPSAMSSLGDMYERGAAGMVKDEAEAARWYRKAAEAGEPVAMVNLGWMYGRGGGGLQKDEREAAKWKHKAVDGLRKEDEAGNERATTVLAYLYAQGGGGLPQDESEALRLFRRAGDAGDIRAMDRLGWWLILDSLSDGPNPAQKVAEALHWHRKAAEAGDPESMASLGHHYEEGRKGLPPNEVEAAHWYGKAADAGHLESMVSLALMYQGGRGLRKDPAEAVRWLRKGADAGEPEAAYQLGLAYHHGLGVSQDRAQAAVWYGRAASQGHEKGAEMLTILGK
jgi:TPR repeat protein